MVRSGAETLRLRHHLPTKTFASSGSAKVNSTGGNSLNGNLEHVEVACRVILVTVPTIEYGGSFLLGMLRRAEPGYVDNALRHDLFRAGHAHAGVMVVLLSFDLPALGRCCNPAQLARLDWPPGRALCGDPDAIGILSVEYVAAS